MSSGFDPYREWLGLDGSTEPLDHYQLLGLARFESDTLVIAEAADRALSRVRSHRPGVHSQEWALLLDQITAAKKCLSDPVARADNDRLLRQVGAADNSAPLTNPDAVIPDAVIPDAAIPDAALPAVRGPQVDPMAPAQMPAPQQPVPTSPIPGFGNVANAIPGYPAPGMTGYPAPAVDPMAPLNPAAGHAQTPTSALQSTPAHSQPIPGFSNVAPQLNPMAPAAIPAGGTPSPSQPVATAQPAMAQPAMAQPVALAQPAMAQPAMAQPVSASPVAHVESPPPQQLTQSIPANTEASPPLSGPKRSAKALAKSRSQAGMMMPILVGVTIGLVLLVMGGLYVFMGGGSGNVIADANPGYGPTPPAVVGPSAPAPLPPTPLPPTPGPPTPGPQPVPAPSPPEPNPPEPGPTMPEPTPPQPPTPEPTPPEPTPPAPTPEPAPPEPMPPQPSREDLVKLSTKLKSARAALAKHDFAVAITQLDGAAPLAMLDAHREKVERLRRVTELATGFHEAIVTGTSKLQAGESLQVKDSAVGIVETSADRVVLRVGGVNKRYSLSALPLGLAVVLAHQAVSPTDPQTIAQKACYVITSPTADVAAKSKARDWFVEAATSLPDVADLADVMKEDFDLVPGVTAPTDTPLPPTTPDPATKPTRENVMKLATALAAARRAIAARKQDDVEKQLAAAEALAVLPEHKQKLWRLQRLAEHVGAFDEAMKEAVAGLKPGDIVKVGSSTELTVERVNPASLAVEVAGLKKTYPLGDPPLGLAVALVQTQLASEAPLTKAIQAAFVVVSKNSDDRSLAKARTWYEEAAAGNSDFATLGEVIDDDYNLLKDFQAE